MNFILAIPFLFLFPGGHNARQDVFPGPQPPVLTSIEIIGSEHFEQKTLVGQLKLLRVGLPYHTGRAEYDIRVNLESFLKENGFMKCRIEWKEQVLTDGSVGIEIDVDEGTQYRLSQLEIQGVTAFAPEELKELFQLQSGEVLNDAKVKQGLKEMQRLYRENGFLDFSWLPEQIFDETRRTVGLSFEIMEGLQYRVERVGIVGCGDQAEEDRVRALIDLRPGDVFRPGKVAESAARINGTGIYAEIGEKDCVFNRAKGEPGRIVVLFYLKPKEEAA